MPPRDFAKELSAIISHKYDELIVRYSFLAETEWWKKKTIILFGCGSGLESTRDDLRIYDTAIKYLCDNNPAKHGKIIDGLEVISPDRLSEIKDVFVIITVGQTAAVSQIIAQLEQRKIDHIGLSEFTVLFLKNNEDKTQKVLSILADEQSKIVYSTVIRGRLEKSSKLFASIYSPDQYFYLPEFFKYDPQQDAGIIFIDAGSFTGESIERWWIKYDVSTFTQKIYAFEPSPRNYAALQCRTNRLKNEWAIADDVLVCVNAGLGENTETAPFAGENLIGSSFVFSASNSGENAKVYSLDDFLNGAPATFIKADIEGYELKMLRGAKNTIQKYRPKIAICIYHKILDLYEIPLLLKEYVPEYKFMVRHHATTFAETVLYCFVDDE